MGVKSTVTLTRDEAEEKLAHLVDQIGSGRALPTPQLEWLLEALNDVVQGGEGYENYRIEG